MRRNIFITILILFLSSVSISQVILDFSDVQDDSFGLDSCISNGTCNYFLSNESIIINQDYDPIIKVVPANETILSLETIRKQRYEQLFYFMLYASYVMVLFLITYYIIIRVTMRDNET